MRERIAPWLPAIFCGVLTLITVVTDVVGQAMTGTSHVGLTTFLCFLPMCFFFVGVMLKKLRDENHALKRRLDEAMPGHDQG
jgi:hypothetical protein